MSFSNKSHVTSRCYDVTVHYNFIPGMPHNVADLATTLARYQKYNSTYTRVNCIKSNRKIFGKSLDEHNQTDTQQDNGKLILKELTVIVFAPQLIHTVYLHF